MLTEHLTAVVLAPAAVLASARVALHQRPLGSVSPAAANVTAMVQATAGRGIFHADLAALTDDREWYVEVSLSLPQAADGSIDGAARSVRLVAPAGAPSHWQSVVVIPQGDDGGGTTEGTRS